MSSTQSTLVENEETSSDQINSSKHDNIISLPVSVEMGSQKSIVHDELTKVSSEHQENLSTADCDDDNIKVLFDQEIVKSDQPSLRNMEYELLSGKSDTILEGSNSDNDDDLELKYEDELDDDVLINEDALLEDNIEIEDDMIKIQDEKDVNLKFENSSDIHEIVNTTNEQTDDSNINPPRELVENNKVREKQAEEPLETEQNLSSIIENQNKVERNEGVTSVGEIIEDCVNTSEDKSEPSISTSKDTSFEPITEHGLNKPDMMLEIPTQELIEFSDDDEDDVDVEYGTNILKISSDIEDIIDLEESINHDLVNIDEKQINNIENVIISSANVNAPILVKTTMNTDESHTSNVKSCIDTNIDLTDNRRAQIDINTNALSYEAEIAADIITKEMNAMDDESPFTPEANPIEDLLAEEDVMNSETKNLNETVADVIIYENQEISKEESQLMEVENENSDIIELSDDNIENETEDERFESDNAINILADTNLCNDSEMTENELRLARMEEDIINDVREIDELILSKKICKTKIMEDETKEAAIEFESSRSEQNVSITETVRANTSNQYTDQTDKIIDMDTSHENTITIDSTKTIKTTISDDLTKQTDIVPSVTNEDIKSVESSSALQPSTSGLETSEECTSQEDTLTGIKASPQSHDALSTSKMDSEVSREKSSEPNETSLLLPAYTEPAYEQTSESGEQMSKETQCLKSTTEVKGSVVEHPESSKSNTALGTLEISEMGPSTSKMVLEVTDSVASKSSSSKLELTDDPKPSTSTCVPEISETNIKVSISKKEATVKIDVDPKPSSSKLLLKVPEKEEPTPSTSKAFEIIETNQLDALDSKPNSPKNQSALGLSLAQDSSNDIPEMTDSLGLLAESSRVMEDDEEHDYYDDVEDEDDFDHDDESSNQMTAEHSEDSNTHHSESDGPKDAETPNAEKEAFDFAIIDATSVTSNKPEKVESDLINAEENVGKTDIPVNKETVDKDQSEMKTENMEVETVKLSDTSDTEDNEKKKEESLLKTLLLEDDSRNSNDPSSEMSRKTRNLSISKQESIMTFVDLEESSSDDANNATGKKLDAPRKSTDSNKESRKKIRELIKSKQENVMSIVDLEENSSDDDKNQAPTNVTAVETNEAQPDVATKVPPSDVTSNDTTETVKDTEISSSKSVEPVPEITTISKEVVADKSPSKADTTESIPPETKPKSPMGLEVFNLDSDEEEDSSEKEVPDIANVEEVVTEEVITEQSKLHETVKCINRSCANNDTVVGYYVADTTTAIYFDADKKKRAYVCEKCAEVVEKRNQDLVEGIKNFTPLLELHTSTNTEELVEILDSESDEEPEPDPDDLQVLGSEVAKMLEEKLAGALNETWEKFKMDSRLTDTQSALQKEIEKLQKEGQEIDALFNECQAETDRLRNSLYATFDPDIQELPSIVIYDMPNCSYTCLEPPNERRQLKRRLSTSKELETPAKKSMPGISDNAGVLSKLDKEAIPPFVEKVDDDNTDIAVVKLSAESAPADLPPPGELSHPPIKVGMTVYAMKNAFGTWLRAKVVEIQPKSHATPFTMCRVRFEHKVTKNPFKTLPARCLAYFDSPEVRMTIGTRVIALFKDISSRQAFYSGIVAEIPNPVNNYRYLIFFDDGYAQYAPHSQTRLVCECSSLVWEEVHPYSREFVRAYLIAYPERPMVRLHAGQNLKTEWRGKWWSSRVVNVDASLVEVQFLRCDRREWIYRGSTRLAPLYLELQAAERHRPRALPRSQPQSRTNMPYVEYTRSDEQANKQSETHQQRQQQLQQQHEQEIRRQRSVAKKSTAASQPPPQSNASNLDNVTSRVVYYTPKNAVKPYKMTPHTCTVSCKRSDVLALKDLRTYNPLAKPLLSGWERQIVRWKGHKEVMYVSPCGRRLRNMKELHRYLRATDADMPVDLFDFSPSTHCLAEFVMNNNKCFVGKKDLSHGKENVPVPCVNYYDESLPEFCSYNTERTPTAGVPLNLDPEFLCGCDCEDDCADKSKCACWKMTLEGARTIGYEGDVGYVYRRLPEPLPSGIYECNSRCKCKNTCLNRVAQHPLQLKLQVFKTLNRGWGIRALNDVPKGAFLCVYAGNLLTDATANLDGLNEGDEYLAELDYIEVVEQMKEGFEEDIPEKIKALDKKEMERKILEGEDDEESSEEETCSKKTDQEDDDFQPGYIGLGVAEFSKRLRRRDSKKESEDTKPNEKEKEKDSNPDEECITISDDEEVREPSCFTAAAGMGANEFVSKYSSVRTLFGEDEACYIMDAKVQGNIGRYLNHSCTPNVFVQNVFVDTHDPRFPWVAFFALNHIRASTELTWNYNYDVGSVPGKVLYCFCGAQNCRGRLL